MLQVPNLVKSDLVFNERLTEFSVDINNWQEALYNEGYTLDDYSFICRDHLYDETFNQETGEYEKKYKYDKDGNPVYRYGLRYEEISMLNMWQTKKLKNTVNELIEENKKLKKRIENIENILSS